MPSPQIPIVELIRQNLIAQLASIRFVTPTNNAQTLTVLGRPPAEGVPPASWQCVVDQLGEERLAGTPTQKRYAQRKFTITTFYLADASDDNDPDYYLNLMWTQIYNQIISDRQQSRLSGSDQAIDTYIDSTDPFESITPGAFQGIIITLTVKYQTSWNDVTAGAT